MVNDKETPVEWALLMYDISEVQEHVKSLMLFEKAAEPDGATDGATPRY